MERAQSIDQWISLAARLVGLAGLVAFGIVWITTNRVEPLLVAAAGGLYGLGKGGEAIALLRQPPPAPPAIPLPGPTDATAAEGQGER